MQNNNKFIYYLKSNARLHVLNLISNSTGINIIDQIIWDKKETLL